MVAAAIMFAVAKHEEIIFLTVTSIVGCIGMLLVLIAILLAHVAEYWKGSEMIALFLVSAAYCFVCGRLRDDSRPITKPPATGPLQPPPDPNQGMWGDAS